MPYRLPVTFLAAIPIEAPCYAVRLGFVNVFNFPVTIAGASIYTSDSYSVCSGMTADAASEKWFPVPTGAASAGTRVTFDCGGSSSPLAGTQMVNVRGSTFAYTLPADPTNGSNTAKPVTIQWSDFVPVVSIPQSAAPSGPHILFIYITIASPGMVHGGTNWFALAADAKAGGRRQYYGAVAWEEGGDFNCEPAGTGFRRCQRIPQFALQYLTPASGIQCVSVGDSLTAAPAIEQYSTAIWRAAADLSTATCPIEVASMLFSAANSSAYNVSLQNNAPAIRPSILFCQPLSRNDGVPVKHGLLPLLARSLAQANELQSLYGTRLVLNSPGCEPSFDGEPRFIAAFNDLLARLRAIGAEGTIPHIDGPSVLGQPDAPWNYIQGVSDDGDHPNSAGVELLVPLTKQAMLTLIGPSRSG